MADSSSLRDPQTIRDTAHEILQRSEFRPPKKHWWDPIAAFFSDPIGSVMNAYLWVLGHWPDGAAGIALAVFVAVLAVLLAGALIVHFTSTVTSDPGVGLVYAPSFGLQSARDLIAEAEEHESKGEWRDAIRARYAALLVQLSDDDVVKGRPGRTTGEYVAEVEAALPNASEPFRSATGLFEWVWYGAGVAEADDVAKFRDFADRVRGLVVA